MARTLDWKSSDDPRDIVHIIVQALVEGKLVALPAETAYHVVASALKPAAVDQLVEMNAQQGKRPPNLFLRSAAECQDYVPQLSRVASRIVCRGWPGPLVLELPIPSQRSLADCLPPEVVQALLQEEKFLALRVAAHEAIRHAMRLMPGPLVAAPLCDPAGQPICQADGLRDQFGQQLSAIVDDGKTHFGGLATSVRVEDNLCRVLHAGVLDREALQRLGQLVVLLVCTGNTCRSPMAEAILRSKLKERFPKLMSSELQPAFVVSAGLSAFPGGPASPEAISVMKKRGLSLLDHQSRAVTERGLRHADLVLTMTASHRSAIVDKMPEIAGKVHLLSGSPQDVSDPFGGSESVYAACADQLEGYLERWVDQMEDSWFPSWQFN